MPPRKSSHDILPECAANMATTTQQVKEIAKDLAQVAETIYGNGKPGLRELTESNIRDIASNAKMIEEMIEVRKLETQARLEETQIRKKEAQDRKREACKWWRGQAASVITAILVVIQTIVITLALTHIKW
jgi:hypothetical protein